MRGVASKASSDTEDRRSNPTPRAAVLTRLEPGFLPWQRPTTAMVELTNLCNLRCQMCGIWSERPNIDLGVDRFEGLLQQRAIRNVKLLALTGGEPFMIDDFEAYYRAALRLSPRSHINISTNGWYTDRTLDLLRGGRPERTSITISYDGVYSHDEVRRMEGSQAKLLDTATQVRREFPKVPLSLKLTVTQHNVGEIEATAEQCRSLGIGFRFKTLERLRCHQSRSPSKITGPNYDQAALTQITRQGRAVLAMDIDTNRRYIERLVAKHEEASGESPGPDCSCSPRVVFVGVDGNVFLCRKKDPIGNVRSDDFDSIWRSAIKRERVEEMEKCPGAELSLGFTHD